MIRGAIFDVDGTLLDSMKIWRTIGEIYLRSLGLEPEAGLAGDLKTLTLPQAARYFQDRYGVALSVEEIMEGVNGKIEDFYFHRAQLRPGVRQLLERLGKAGVRMDIATATDRYLVEAALERCGIRQYFLDIVTCTDYGSKEKPEIYLMARQLLGTELRDTWVFEDACHGARTAARAGFPVLGIRDPSEEDQQGLKKVSAVYLESFLQADSFWKQVSL